ncbi:MAG: class I SAM-dependent methyltransferase [Sulfurospirillum sp.]|jgi:SAM-dependent methyltransferase|nr:class I SAM-dependent methyltransferase [Sulfurospirillum sp.]
MKKKDASIWDKKAESYTRFSHNPNSFQALILSKVKQRDICFDGKNILDIGCGTGVYTLHIAKNALHVNALDFSQEMLNILHEDAIKEGLYDKFTFTCNTWSGFESQENFDIVFSSMSPAFESHADFEKMHHYAREACVFLGWGGKRESSLLDPIFKAHGKALNVPAGSEKLRAWLESANIAYESEYIEEKTLHVKSYEKAEKSVLWHFEINNLIPDTQHIKAFLQTMQDEEGNIAFETTIGVELISWKK